MSEPKGSLDDATTTKKTSKKSRGDVAPGGTGPVMTMSPVPMLNLSEPKGSEEDERRARSSKKKTAPNSEDIDNRTSTTESTSRTNDVDTEKEKARREAKKQRAREAEEQKRREQLEQQAIEEARRQQEQRERERRRQQELAALNANAEECQENYEEEGFENYDDDFEAADDVEMTPPPKTTHNITPLSSKAQAKAAKASHINQENELKKIQQALQAESKELSTSRPSSVNTSTPVVRESKKTSVASTPPTSSIASSIAGLKQSLDPRGKRIKEILEVVQLEMEQFHLFQQVPLSSMDQYMHHMRRGHLKQAMNQTNEGAKAMMTQTKTPEMKDQSMHFPDDIGLEDVRHMLHHGYKKKSNQEEEEEEEEEEEITSGTRFFHFLEQASHVVEILIEENNLEIEQTHRSNHSIQLSSHSQLSKHQIFPSRDFSHSLLTQAFSIMDLQLVAIVFSPFVSNLLITCYTTHQDTKSWTCVWDVNQLDQVLYVLENEGRITTCCMGPTRELFVFVGTNDGSIHCWDLRSRLHMLHPRRMIIQENILEIYGPMYSTFGRQIEGNHVSTIVSLQVFSSSTQGLECCSLDDRGILILWSLIEYQSNDETLLNDPCVEIGGRIKLVPHTILDLQPCYLSLTRSRSKNNLILGPIATTLAFDPYHSTQFLMGTTMGFVLHGHRFEKISSSIPLYYRSRSIHTPVVSITWVPYQVLDGYFLVGYEDGAVCLYHKNISTPLTTWEEIEFGTSIVDIQWSTTRPSVFYVTYSNQQILIWDLLIDTSHSICSHQLDVESSIQVPLAFSSTQLPTSPPVVALMTDRKTCVFQFELHILSSEFTSLQPNEVHHVKQRFQTIL